MNKDIKILGVGITNATFREVLEYLVKNAENSSKKIFVTTINSEFLVTAYRNLEFRNVLNSSNLALIDGMWTLRAGRFLGFPLKEKISGVDLMEKLCEEASKR